MRTADDAESESETSLCFSCVSDGCDLVRVSRASKPYYQKCSALFGRLCGAASENRLTSGAAGDVRLPQEAQISFCPPHPALADRSSSSSSLSGRLQLATKRAGGARARRLSRRRP
uniref:Uncharacterized protein n=1 Tax=Plectus sambesii TaxID=2011161 RepID=A0A914WQQ5_9BILA